MAVKKMAVFIAVIFWFLVYCEYTGKQVIKHISRTIGQTVLECQKEVEFDDDIIADFLNYWNQRYPLENGELGCVVYCVILKLELVELNGTLRMENTKAFAHANGADDVQFGYLRSIYERCRNNMTFEDPCKEGMMLANCFRAEIFKMEYAPDPGDHFDDEF